MKKNRQWLRLAITPMLSIGTLLAAPPAEEPGVSIKTEMPQRKAMAETITAYGTVVPDTGAVETISLPRQVRIDHLRVAVGQIVKPGEALIDLATDATTSASFHQAETAVLFARGEIQRLQGMAARRLATRSQVAAAQKALDDAEAALAAAKEQGAGLGRETLKSPFTAVVAAIGVQQGDRVQAGAALMQLARAGLLRATLGIEPEDIKRVRPGMEVDLAPVFGSGKTVRAKVAKVFGIINPQTRLVDISIQLTAGTDGLMPGMQVRGAVQIRTLNGWAIPRSAVLRDAHGAYLFQVAEGHARRVEVNPGIENGPQVLVTGPLDATRRIVIQGNYELKDGMAVREGRP